MANGGKRNGEKANPVIIVGVLIIVALLGVIVALVMTLNRPAPEPAPEPEHEQRAVVVNEDNIDEVLDRMEQEETVEAGYYEARMTTTWTFPDGSSLSPDAYVENVTANTHDVYFDVEMRETGEVIYESPVIPRGSHLRDFALDTPLAAGTYNCVVVYYMVDEDQRVVDNLRMGITVIVDS